MHIIQISAFVHGEWIYAVGYFSITKSGGIRKTNFSGGTDKAEFNEIDNNDGTVSFKVRKGKFKDWFIALDADKVCLDKDNAAKVVYDLETLTLTNKDPLSELNDAELYVNTQTGYFYFGFSELNKDAMERERWDKRQGGEKIILTPDGWQKKAQLGFEKCAFRYEQEVLERSAGLR